MLGSKSGVHRIKVVVEKLRHAGDNLIGYRLEKISHPHILAYENMMS